jgi:hypothetical protein
VLLVFPLGNASRQPTGRGPTKTRRVVRWRWTGVAWCCDWLTSASLKFGRKTAKLPDGERCRWCRQASRPRALPSIRGENGLGDGGGGDLRELQGGSPCSVC